MYIRDKKRQTSFSLGLKFEVTTSEHIILDINKCSKIKEREKFICE